MLGGATPEMVAAVSNAGGMGGYAASMLDGEGIGRIVSSIRSRTDKPFNLNLFVQDPPNPTADQLQRAFDLLDPLRAELGLPPAKPLAKYCENFREQLDAVIDLKLPVVSFTFGLLDAESVERLHHAGSIVIGTVTNVAEALAWEQNGADVICASGSESGGHRGTFIGSYESSMTGTMVLVPQVVDSVKLPVIAAGGIMDGRGIKAALALGAQAVQMGTAFLVTAEGAIHRSWKQRIRDAGDTSTRTTKLFTGRAARGIVNEFMERLKDHEDEIPPYPIQNALTADMRQMARELDRMDYLSLWAGQGAAMTKLRQAGISAHELMEQLKQEIAA